METEVLGVGFDFYWPPPPHLLLDTHDLPVVNRYVLLLLCFYFCFRKQLMAADWYSMYMPQSDAGDSLSSLYPYCEDSNSPDSSPAAVPTTSSSPPQHPEGGGGAVSKNMVMERDRRRRLNEKLYELRSVVPNITKVLYVQPDRAGTTSAKINSIDLFLN